ncbi:hypothetical protein [Flavobacterium soli]|uniref:hypothetical protein n=1 Tax=Flavobacterium soli TaxID=344881 RepID=UPI0012F73C23|nr:hypothetical protein [Flavobacterium soli]
MLRNRFELNEYLQCFSRSFGTNVQTTYTTIPIVQEESRRFGTNSQNTDPKSVAYANSAIPA